MYPLESIYQKFADWFPTQFEHISIPIWCFLTGDAGKALAPFLGLGGLILTVTTLWALPSVGDCRVITRRNEKRSYRLRTIFVGIVALIAFLVASSLYVFVALSFGPSREVCEKPEAIHGLGRWVGFFLLSSMIALPFLLWLKIRAAKLKHK